MRKLGLVLSLLAVLGLALPWAVHADNTVGPTNQVICNKTAQVTASAAGTLSLVNGVANQSIFVCGWHATTTQSTGPLTFQFESGTQGGPCTTPTVITPAFNILNTAPSGDHISIATIQAPAAAQLCGVFGGTVTNIAVIVYYSQF